MIRLEVSVRIYRMLSEVFAFAGDPRNDVHWAGSVLECEQITPGPLTVGTRGRQRSKFLGIRTDSESEVTVYTPQTRVCLAGVQQEASGSDCRLSSAEEGDTRFTRVIRGRDRKAVPHERAACSGGRPSAGGDGHVPPEDAHGRARRTRPAIGTPSGGFMFRARSGTRAGCLAHC